jgi:Uma2 family endonuclease
VTTATLPTVPTHYGPPPPRVRRFTVDEYRRMIEDGYFAADEQFELLEGWIVEKVSRNPPHDSVLNRSRRRIERALPPEWMARVQMAITTADSEPEPDIATVRGDDADYESRHPGPADTALIVEVANTSLAEDRGVKLRVYARAGISVYWIVNLNDRSIEVYTDPTGPAAVPTYRARTDYAPGQSIPFALAGVEMGPIPAGDLLG